jgi:hypothetical protein
VSDADAGADPLTVSVAAEHGFVIPNPENDLEGLQFVGGNEHGFTARGSLAAVQEALTSGIWYAPPAPPEPESEQAPNDKVTVTVDDGHGGSDTVNFIFNNYGMGPIALDGTAGKDVIFATGWQDTLTGHGGADTFVFSSEVGSAGQDLITDFDVHDDKIDLRGAPGIQELADLAATQEGADTILHLGGDDTIRLQGVDINQLSVGNFIFNNQTI